jgi:hypothetical protein
VAGGVDAGEEECCNLGEHEPVGQGPPSCRVLGGQEQRGKAARLERAALDVAQQRPHNLLRKQKVVHAEEALTLYAACLQTDSW